MAKERMITRTIITTECDVMLVNTDTAQVEIVTLQLKGKYTDKEQALKAFVKMENNEGILKPVAIKDMRLIEQLYALSEDDFIRYGHKIESR